MHRKWDRRAFLNTAGLGAAAAALPNCARLSERTDGRRPPNILLVVSDDQGYHDLGCFSNAQIIETVEFSVG
jgi:hypothetical protein